ncbi:alpha/beta hydrolase [Paenibacillus sediminis]|uniref:Fermentation-respiration switch protein FrsA (DUF1100 family) n=1 Tax=Paenibacillus sediminis TaxID=664909 RepID=A0ABS4H671_9BACL|nr:alpha/beta hydrolase [Paenibacillus sediminis]MBP1938044.1 fermentation-respiration switch protein FrsA (DUF1100 family) [Paenibacillus sediminis]
MLYTVVGSTFLLILIAIQGMSHYAVRQITQMRLQKDETIYDVLEKNNLYSKQKFDTLAKQRVQIQSEDGIKLNGIVIENYPYDNKWVIIVHGYTGSLLVSTQFIDMFENMGFNLLLVDQRRHGKSEGMYTTYGYYEKRDVQSWVRWLLQEKGTDIVIGLHGQSLGGGTVLEYLSIAHPNVKFVIADCPYSDLHGLITYQMKVLHKIPAAPFLHFINRKIYRKAGFRLEDVSPIKTVMNSHLPILFIHGGEDRYVPTEMSEQLYEAKPGFKKLVIIPGAVHANSYIIDPVLYAKEVRSFVEEALSHEPTSQVSVQEERSYDLSPDMLTPEV